MEEVYISSLQSLNKIMIMDIFNFGEMINHFYREKF